MAREQVRFSIKTGWATDYRIVSKYPGEVAPLDAKQFEQWLSDADRICELYNAALSPATEVMNSALLRRG